MQTLAVVSIASALTVAAGAIGAHQVGLFDGLFDSFDFEGLDCTQPLVATAGDKDGTIVLEVINKDDAGTVRFCVYDSDRNKVHDSTHSVPANDIVRLRVELPRAFYAAVAEVQGAGGGSGRAGATADLRLCEAYVVEVETSFRKDGIGIGSNSGGCTSASEAAKSEFTAGSDDEGILGGKGGAIGRSGVAAAGILTLGAAPFLVWRRNDLKFLALGLFTRLQRPTILDQETRARIHDLVVLEPGIHPAAIAERLELAGSQVLHHLRVLTREKMLVRVRSLGRNHYFLAGRYQPTQMRLLAALRHDSLQRVYRDVLARPNQTLTDVSARAGMSLSRASKLTQRLCGEGLLVREQAGRAVRFRVAQPA